MILKLQRTSPGGLAGPVLRVWVEPEICISNVFSRDDDDDDDGPGIRLSEPLHAFLLILRSYTILQSV